MALSTPNSGANSGGMNSAEPLSSRNCSEAAPANNNNNYVDENAYESADEQDEVKDESPSTPKNRHSLVTTTPKRKLGCLDSSMNTSVNTSALTSPDDHRSPEPVLDADIERLRHSVPSLLNSFRVIQKIGEGTFSTVFKAHPLDPSTSHVTVALKHIIPASKPQRTENEVKCLKDLDGKDNVCPVLSCIRENDHIVLVMPHVPHDRFQDYMLDLDVEDVREYVWNLMLSLRRVHSYDIIHRDVKPANFLFHRRLKTYCLVDFGLAHPVQLPPPPVIPSGGSRRKSSSAVVDGTADATAVAAAGPRSNNKNNNNNNNNTNDFASLRKSPRKAAKPESFYSDSQRLQRAGSVSPVKRKLMNADDVDVDGTSGAKESIAATRASPRKRQSFGLSLTTTTAETGRRKLSLPTSSSKETAVNDAVFEDGRRSSSPLPPSYSLKPSIESDSYSKDAANASPGGGVVGGAAGAGRTFKSPRRVLLQKRLADQAESSAPPSLRPRNLLLMPSSPATQQQTKKHAANSVVSRTAGPLRATHQLTRGGGGGGGGGGGSVASPSAKPVVTKCACLGKPTICSICSTRPSQNANRAGTPGFRSPEVLLKSHEQNTAVDIWSAGVIFLSVLSGRYPFFKASTDQSALAQIIAIFGIEKVESVAFRLGKKLVCSERCPAVDLQQMCRRLRQSALVAKFGQRRGEERERQQIFPDSAYDLLTRLMDVDAVTRITAAEALQHPFLKVITERKLAEKKKET